VRSFRKAGIFPGLYCSVATNYLLNVSSGIAHGSVDPKTYNAIVIQMLTELWHGYGDLAEIWFDGGVLPIAQGGPDLVPLMRSFQPNALIFNSPIAYPHQTIRWVGNEWGQAPDPNWMLTTDMTDCSDGSSGKGNGTGGIWCPTEADTTLMTQDSWFWSPAGNPPNKELSELMSDYSKTVGRSANLLLNVAPNTTGLVTAADMAAYTAFREAINARYGPQAIVASTDSQQQPVLSLTLAIPVTPVDIDTIILQEDTAHGQRCASYVVYGMTVSGNTVHIVNGTSIGHKKIDHFAPAHELLSLRADFVPLYKGLGPVIRNFAALAASK